MSTIRVAIVGVGNCATSLVEGVTYYRDADPEHSVGGLMHVQFGDYHVRDLEFVAAFDVDAAKVGLDLADAIRSSQNNTIKICDVPALGVEVQRGPTLDGIGRYLADEIDEAEAEAGRFGVFGTTVVAFFLAEMGDKTQIATVALAARYTELVQVVCGTTLGMMLANVPAVLIGEKAATRLPMRLVHGISAAIFAVLGVMTLFNVGRML